MFLDECGQTVYDIFNLITPDDLLLFRKDPLFNNTFRMIGNPGVLCVITVKSDDDFGWQVVDL